MMSAPRRRISATCSLREIVAAAGFTLALCVPMHVEAQLVFEQSLMHMLPAYCRYTQDFNKRLGKDPDEFARWSKLMGHTFIHMHHYCYGLMDVNRAIYLSSTREDRAHNLYQSINEFDYVIERAPLDFSMLPEILTKKGESLILLDRGGEALIEFQRAIKIKADYAPAYAAASDFYRDNRQPTKAREWLQKGLAAAPNANALVRRLATLDRSKDKINTVPRPIDRP